MVKAIILITIIVSLFFLFGYKNNNDIYTLIRSSPAGDDMRIHVATFDAYNGKIFELRNYNIGDANNYNLGNCNIARDLFLSQEGVTVKYWCEKGRFEE